MSDLISSTEERLPNDKILARLSPAEFDSYLDKLTDLLKLFRHDRSGYAGDVNAALNGQPGRELRRRYNGTLLRTTGTFFTGSELAQELVRHIDFDVDSSRLIIDPACGAGDLLVACAKRLPLRNTLRATLKAWGEQCFGFDINRAFVEVTRVRLAILAAHRLEVEESVEQLNLEQLLPNIRVADGSAEWNLPNPPSLIVVNPPFAHTIVDKNTKWTQGRTSQAAIFMARCVEESSDKTLLAAILPDVLRTGYRYSAWRRLLESSTTNMTIEVSGRFDKFTDVDVFLLRATAGKGTEPCSWGYPEPVEGLTLRDLFHIHVGPVVPFRLTNKGPWRPYVHAEVLPASSVAEGFTQHIRFGGTTYKPPFVLVRRTSKSDYRQRCLGTLVVGKEELAIENHLLILSPKDGDLLTCQKLIDLLASASTTEWMNRRIRCRHLTVGSVGEIPWRGES